MCKIVGPGVISFLFLLILFLYIIQFLFLKLIPKNRFNNLFRCRNFIFLFIYFYYYIITWPIKRKNYYKVDNIIFLYNCFGFRVGFGVLRKVKIGTFYNFSLIERKFYVVAILFIFFRINYTFSFCICTNLKS